MLGILLQQFEILISNFLNLAWKLPIVKPEISCVKIFYNSIYRLQIPQLPWLPIAPIEPRRPPSRRAFVHRRKSK
jgi:hypothetical protein